MPRHSTKADTTSIPGKPKRKTAARRSAVRAAGTKRRRSVVPALMNDEVPVMVAEPGVDPVGTHREIQGFVIRSWIVMLGLVSLVLALGTGLWGSAEMVGSDLTVTPPLVHREGRIAGASVDLAAGPVTLRVHDGDNVQTFEVVIAEPLSVYNLLRSAVQTTVLTAEMQNDGRGSAGLVRLAGTTADATHRWQILLNGQELASLDELTVVPGSTLDFQLVER